MFKYVVKILDADVDIIGRDNIDYTLPDTVVVPEESENVPDDLLKEDIMIILEDEIEYDYNDYAEVIVSDVEYTILSIEQYESKKEIVHTVRNEAVDSYITELTKKLNEVSDIYFKISQLLDELAEISVTYNGVDDSILNALLDIIRKTSDNEDLDLALDEAIPFGRSADEEAVAYSAASDVIADIIYSLTNSED